MPDVVTMAKALGNGVPIGACWAKREVASPFQPGDHATTYGGQPLATAAARAVLETMVSIDAPKLATDAGAELTAAVMNLPQVTGVRGLGLLLAVELVGVDAQVAAARCLERGLAVNGRHAHRDSARPTADDHQRSHRRGHGDPRPDPR